MLLEAVVASTDAAATFMLIQQSQINLPPRISNTLVLESGINDPMAIFGTTSILGGSGFLAIYLCGLIIADQLKRSAERILNFSEAL